jgi:hypothetical protein
MVFEILLHAEWWAMDSLYAFKRKRFRSTRHTVTLGISL